MREAKKSFIKQKAKGSLPGMEDLTLLIFALSTHFQCKMAES